MENIRIIDMHAHVYPHKVAEKASISVSNFYNLGMAFKEGTTDILKTIARQAGAVKVVIHSVSTSPKQVVPINDFLTEEAQKDSLFLPFATLHPDMSNEEMKEEIKRIYSLNMKGIKLHPDFQEFAIDSGRAYKIFEKLDGTLPIEIHTGDKRRDFSHPYQMAKAAKDFPHLRFIAAHFGGYSEWKDLDVYNNIDNVYFDTSSSLLFLPPEKVANMIDMLGEDRIMFGTDFPMWNYKNELERLNNIPISKIVIQKILFDNANKFMNLGL